MSKGFVVLAQNTKQTNYVQQAYLLALSIKYSQSTIKNISLITNDKVSAKYKKVFDQVIEIPWVDDREPTRFRAENRWKIYHVSPYDETMVLDSDMLVLEDISDWWEYCTNYNLKFCSRVKNHKLEVIDNAFYRKAFNSNNLTNPYFALHYFKKGQYAHDFYKILEFVSNNWEWCYTLFAPKDYQDCPSMDLIAAISIEVFGCHDQVIDVNSPLEFVHMKPANQNWPVVLASWQDSVPFVLNSKGELVVGNIKQSKIFHYVEDSFVTKNLIQKLEEIADGKKN